MSDILLDERILILTPGGRNARVVANVLQDEGFLTHLCADERDLVAEIKRGAAVVLLTASALATSGGSDLCGGLMQQPFWSDLPLVVVAPPGYGAEAMMLLRPMKPGPLLTLLDQPVSLAALVNAVDNGLQARRRQYKLRDLTAQLREIRESLEARVVAQKREIQALATALTLSEQQERHRLAQVLHDHLQQILYAVQIQVAMIDQHLVKRPEGAGEALPLGSLEHLLEEAIQVTRTLTIDLSPPVLREGLVPALRWLASQMGEVHELEVELDLPEDDKLSDEERVLFFTGARELLFNVVKHAGVSQARLALWHEGSVWQLQVSDKGRGFHAEAMENRSESDGFGLANVSERVRYLGGQVVVHSEPGQGSTITLRLPLRAPSDSAQQRRRAGV